MKVLGGQSRLYSSDISAMKFYFPLHSLHNQNLPRLIRLFNENGRQNNEDKWGELTT